MVTGHNYYFMIQPYNSFPPPFKILPLIWLPPFLTHFSLDLILNLSHFQYLNSTSEQGMYLSAIFCTQIYS